SGQEESRDAMKILHLQLRVKFSDCLDRSRVVAAAFDQEIHVAGSSRPARPAADAVGSRQDKGNLFLGQRTQDLVQVDGGGHGAMAPKVAKLPSEEETFLDGVVVTEVTARGLGRFPGGIAEWQDCRSMASLGFHALTPAPGPPSPDRCPV